MLPRDTAMAMPKVLLGLLTIGQTGCTMATHHLKRA